eukprot:TRINITY_DN589_c0_g2_i2.p1 TRINITY_DN589_c0_g2~~TRINITY_DN589_c0_g2_i2.p1  ORF type:complete len:378 (-),score=54.75 TRINITY_DN589_c0_g2_i2:893-2026(-)
MTTELETMMDMEANRNDVGENVRGESDMSDMSSMLDISQGGVNGVDILRLVKQWLSKKEADGKQQSLLCTAQEFNDLFFQNSECFLGQGSYGYVARYEKKSGVVGQKNLLQQQQISQLQVQNQSQKQYVAIKRQKCSKEEDIRASLTEAYILSMLRHKTMVGCHAIQLNQNQFQIMMDYASGGRLSKISSEGFQKSGQKYAILLEYLLDIVEGLIWLEQNQIVHRDLKPDNILLFKEGKIKRAKLIDFGICKYLGQNDPILAELTKDHRGPSNVFYQSPEELDEEIAEISPKSDIYSFGMIVWELFSDKQPFENRINHNVMFNVPKGLREKIPEDWPRELILMIQSCWQQNPCDRPSAKELYSMIVSMLNNLNEDPI